MGIEIVAVKRGVEVKFCSELLKKVGKNVSILEKNWNGWKILKPTLFSMLPRKKIL